MKQARYYVKFNECTERENELIEMYIVARCTERPSDEGIYNILSTIELKSIKEFVKLLNPKIKIESEKYIINTNRRM